MALVDSIYSVSYKSHKKAVFIMKILIVGAGGIGGFLAPNCTKPAWMLPSYCVNSVTNLSRNMA
jgi:hypothetical protein